MFNNPEHAKNGKNIPVQCSVATCTHHGNGNTCRADSIQVGTEYALDKSETFCSTYKNQSGL